MSLMKKLLHEPLVHFLVIGALLFFAYGLKNEGLTDNDRSILITESNIERLSQQWQKKRQRLPTTEELNALIEQQVHEQVMYREALALGFEQDDPVVRRRLAQKMEFISSDIAMQIAPTDEELTAYLEKHRDTFEKPAQLSFRHVYFSRDRRGEQAFIDAEQLLAELQHNNKNVDISLLGDPSLLAQYQQDLTQYGVARLLGTDFATEVFALPIQSWQGPIVSGYGVHLVRVDNKTSAEMPELETVRDKVHSEWQTEQTKIMDQAFYQGLRSHYQITIEDQAVDKVTLP